MKIHVALVIDRAEVAGIEGIAAQGARGCLRIRQIATGDCTGERGAYNDLAPLAGWDARAGRPDQLNLEPGRGPTNRANHTALVVCRDARAFGHAVPFADLHAEPPFERQPDLAWAATAPGNPRAVCPVEYRWRLLEQNLQNAAEIMDVACTVA